MKYKFLILACFLAIGLILPLASFATQIDSAPTNGLVGYWGFEEATGTTAFDRSGKQNDGIFYNGPASVSGLAGKALRFNGVNSAVQGRVSYGDQYTVSAWVRPTDLSLPTDGYGRTIIASSEDATYFYPIWILVEGTKLRVYAYQSGTGAYVNSVYNNFKINNWYHITVTAIKGGDVKIYINGVYDSISTAGTQATNNYFTIGDLRPNRGIPFSGDIDEVRMYNRVLSATEVSAVYNASVSKVNAQPAIKKTGLDAGLVGYFTMDNQDINWRSSTIIDKSGTTSTPASLIGLASVTSTVVGKVGQAMSFNGTNSYINPPDVALGFADRTISAWVYPKSTSEKHFVGLSNAQFYTSNNSLFIGGGSPCNTNAGAGAIKTNAWNYVTWTQTSASSKIYVNGVLKGTSDNRPECVVTSTALQVIGSIGSWWTIPNYVWNGNIDEVRLYTRSLSGTEVKQLYNQGAGTKVNAPPAVKPLTLDSGLVGYWTMNNQDINWRSQTIVDKSGNGKNGTLVGLGTTTAPAVGKIGQALKFNFSTTSYITVPLINPDTVTYAAWIKTSSYTVQAIMGTNYGNAQIYWHGGINVGSLGKVIMDIGYPLSTYQTITGTKIVSDNKWHFVVMTSDANGSYLYVDGVQDGYSIYNVGQVPYNWESNTTIGAKPIINADTLYSRPFAGLIDEARIYNRALSASEIKQLYNQGK